MRISKRLLSLAAACLASATAMTLLAAPAQAASLRAENLRVEYLVDPLGIDAAKPRLMWTLAAVDPTARNLREDSCEILVASSPEKLAANAGDLWTSGRIVRNGPAVYEGKPLTSRQECYWKVRVTDQDGKASEWSTPASWTMGLLNEESWGGSWIGTTTERKIRTAAADAVSGYHSLESQEQDKTKWVQIDLGGAREVDELKLRAARPKDFSPDTPGFGFPVRFKIETSDTEDFSSPRVLVDHTSADFRNPGLEEVKFPVSGKVGRFIRLTATRLWPRGDGNYVLALKGFEVVSKDINIAQSATVTSLDSIERTDWNRAALTRTNSAPTDEDTDDAAPLLRRNLNISEKAIRRATATICGLGYQILYINGKRVGTAQLDPGWTNYDKRCLYVTYDVSSLLKNGKNAIGVMLGNGWYDQTTPDIWNFHTVSWAAPPKLRFNLQIDYTDGSSETVVSDKDWKWSTGEIIYQNIRSGETHDKRRTVTGWSEPSFDDAGWKSAMEVPAPKGALRAQMHPPIRATGEVPVVEVSEPKQGIYILKMAEHISGWVRFKAEGKPGQKITLRQAETLLPDGTLNMDIGGFTFGRFQADVVILDESGKATFEPQFSYKAFQYVQVEGATTAPAATDLVGVKVHTDFAESGSFECSDPLINQIQAMMRRTYLNNMHGLPTDCPHREKLGWLCDGFMASEMGLWNFDAVSLYEKWIRDMEDDQQPDGRIGPIIPGSGWFRDPEAPLFDPLWTGVTVFLPWRLYQFTGDTTILAEHYDSMKRYVDLLEANSVAGLIEQPRFTILGDWLEVDYTTPQSTRTPHELAGNVAWFQCAQIFSRISRLLGRREEAKHYASVAENTRSAINAKWYDANGKTYGNDSQAGPAQALDLRVAPDADRPSIVENLVANIRQRDGHLSTGIVGSYHLFKTLQHADRNDVAWEIATQTTYPGWGDLISKGATTVWEQWAGSSRSHPAQASPGFWFYEGLAGIRPASPGFAKIIVKPAIPEGLDWVKASYRAPAGEIRSHWKRDGSQLSLEVSVPPNVAAEISVPAKKGTQVLEGGNVKQPKSSEGDRANFELGSGTYVFRSQLPQ